MTEEPLWLPSQGAIAHSQMDRFRLRVEGRYGVSLPDFTALHAWSVARREEFWREVWDTCGVIGDGPGETILVDRDRMPGARWLPDARLNFAENLLRRDDDTPALVYAGEDGARRELSWAELRSQVARLAAALRELGVERGDRVAGILPNVPEAVIAMLATTSQGGIWSSCSPDFGPDGVCDRFGQIEPRVLLCADGYFYGGKHFDTLARMPEIAAGLPSVEHIVVMAHTRDESDITSVPNGVRWDELLSPHASAALAFERLPFDHPLAILYSSGTTGKPKCIVHGAGGTLLQHLKEHQLHLDVRPGERIFYFTTCGWMMWNWLVSTLASEATLVLYDGSPFQPDGEALFDLAERERIDVFGISARFLDVAAKERIEPRRTHDLRSLRAVLSTGSPLGPEGFDYVEQKVKPGVQLASISGGTDLISCFVLGNPTLPVWRGEIQGPGLGMDVLIYDDAGHELDGETGELVCASPFPSMPVGFWRDETGERYRAAYFERFPGVWCHGDWTRRTVHGGYVIAGRSDAVLNPGGVRIGTAEIYRQVERLDEVLEAIAVGQRWRGDVRIVLFVRLRAGVTLDEALARRIRGEIRRGASPRHVPTHILAVPDIPRTRSGKISELAVRDVLHGRPVKNIEALANPEALVHFRDRAELAD